MASQLAGIVRELLAERQQWLDDRQRLLAERQHLIGECDRMASRLTRGGVRSPLAELSISPLS